MDWRKFHGKVASLSIQPQIVSVCRFMGNHWKIAPPELKRYVLQTDKVANKRNMFGDTALMNRDKKRKEIFDYVENLKTAGELEGWGKRLYFLGRYLIPKQENLISRYGIAHRWNLPLFYFIHPFVLSKRALLSLCQHCCNEENRGQTRVSLFRVRLGCPKPRKIFPGFWP